MCCNGQQHEQQAAARETPRVAEALDRAGWKRELPVVPNCEHWRDVGARWSGQCAAGKYQNPSLGVCMGACPHYTGPLEERIELAWKLANANGRAVLPRDVIEQSVRQADPKTRREMAEAAIRKALERQTWRFVRWAGLWWMGDPWPRRLTFSRKGTKPARRDGLCFWTRIVPGLRERDDVGGCGCMAWLKMPAECWKKSRAQMRDMIAMQLEVDQEKQEPAS